MKKIFLLILFLISFDALAAVKSEVISGSISASDLASTSGSGAVVLADGATIGSNTPVQIQGYAPTNYQTGTTYTLVLADAGKRVSLSNAAAITLTVPNSSTVAFPAETEIIIRQGGAGQVTIVGAGGVTVNSFSSLTHTAGQWAYATLKLSSTANTWDLFGNLN